MYLIDCIIYFLLTIKAFLMVIGQFCISQCISVNSEDEDNKIKVKVEVKKYTPKCSNRSKNIHKKCEGCNSPEKPLEVPKTGRFLSNRKISKKQLENAGFAKPTLSSMMKKTIKPDTPETFQRTLRKYTKYNSTSSVSSHLTTISGGSGNTKPNQGVSNKNVLNVTFTSEQFCYGTTKIIEEMDEVVSHLPPIPTEKCVATKITEKSYKLGIATVDVHMAEIVRQYDSDDSQIFTDESPESQDEDRRSTPESEENNVSEDSQIYSEEDERRNDQESFDNNIADESLRQRISSGLAKIDKLAQDMNAENDPFYRRIFANLRNATIFLCETSDDWELGKNREENDQ